MIGAYLPMPAIYYFPPMDRAEMCIRDRANGMQLADFAKWKALDMAGDFVRLANAGDLAYEMCIRDRRSTALRRRRRWREPYGRS